MKRKYMLSMILLFLITFPLEIFALTITDIYEKYNPAVVQIISSSKDSNKIKYGSGFIVKPNGVIVTNLHVIKNSTSIKIKLISEAWFGVTGIIGIDEEMDIAILKVQGKGLSTVKLGDSEKIKVGERVIAIGSPLGLENTVSEGIISSIRFDPDSPQAGKFIQTTVPISPGSSGGPLLNLEGEVIGITTFKIKGGENINFCIPANFAKKLLGETRNKKPKILTEEKKPTIENSYSERDKEAFLIDMEKIRFFMNKKYAPADEMLKSVLDQTPYAQEKKLAFLTFGIELISRKKCSNTC